MFRLSQFQDDVRHWVKTEARVRPAKFEKILLDTLSEPLPDVSVSRPSNRVHWAIPVPDDDSQTVKFSGAGSQNLAPNSGIN